MKIKILKVEKKDYGYCSECGYESHRNIYGITGWDEVDEATRSELQEAIYSANSLHKNKFYYFMIEILDDYAEVLDTANDFIAHVKKQKEVQLQRDKKNAENREKAKLEKKRKQLAKLRKELGDE